MTLLNLVLVAYDKDGKAIPPRTKKTHNQVIQVRGRSVVLPSAAFRKWEVAAHRSVRGMKYLPIHEPVSCRALFYRDRLSGDATGFYQALGDFLQNAGFIVNDKQIEHWDGSRLLKDATNPRIEVVLERA